MFQDTDDYLEKNMLWNGLHNILSYFTLNDIERSPYN